MLFFGVELGALGAAGVDEDELDDAVELDELLDDSDLLSDFDGIEAADALSFDAVR